ncbi:MAG: hypothetical protein KF861_14705 [Planctomycetaceae bacterium]|nr:hypothetical protein [Planctomycetaceae bacterium]
MIKSGCGDAGSRPIPGTPNLAMLDLDADLFLLSRHDHCVLQAYLSAEQRLLSERTTPPQTDAEQLELSRWVDRIREVPDVPSDRLAPIHGRLIALGYLQFQLQGRDAGVVYRVTAEGRSTLETAAKKASNSASLRQSA